ncbi:TPA: hypothetical protein ACMDVD_004448 [Vibrio parahaemolyticus]
MDDRLLLALVASSSAVGGVLITQVFTILRERLEARGANRVLVREKYEELVESINESIVHRVKVYNIVCDEEFHRSLLNTPLQRAYTLSLIYFPELVDPIKNYNSAYVDFCMMLGKSLMPGDSLSVGMRAVWEQGSAIDSVQDKIDSTQKELDECIAKYSRKYAKA